MQNSVRQAHMPTPAGTVTKRWEVEEEAGEGKKKRNVWVEIRAEVAERGLEITR